MHAFGLSRSAGTSAGRSLGMALTWIVIVALALVLIFRGLVAGA